MTIIGITGKKRSGKDTVAEHIKTRVSVNCYERVAFADALKKEVAQAIGKPIGYVEDNKAALRLLLQSWGTDYRRNLCDKNYWITKFLLTVRDLPNHKQVIVVPDVRFLNEAQVIHELGGFIIRVVRPSDVVLDNHASEIEMDQIQADYGIVNDSSLQNLTKQTEVVFRNITNKLSIQ